ncbi:MAG: hypothetical protein Fues2KO_52130 [Fuerstiella sp.]
MSLWQRFKNRFGSAQPAPKQASQIETHVDGLTAAAFNDFRKSLTGGGGRGTFRGAHYRGAAETWDPSEYSPNSAWMQDAGGLRRRAWNLYNNNPFAQSAIETLILNAVGSGILPERDDPAWDRGFRRWSGLDAHATCEADIEGDCTLPELEAIWLREVMLSGGCLTNYHYLPRRSQRVPVSVELIAEERFADNLQYYGRNSKTRHRIVLGRELDPRGRTVAFHVLPAGDDLTVNHNGDPIRIPAENARYTFRKRRTGEKRGTTMLRTAIIWFHALGYYFDRELFNSNLRNRWAYVIERDPEWCPTGSENELEEVQLIDAATQEPTDVMQPSMVYQTTNGGSIKMVGPNVPQADSVPWLKLMERAIALSVLLSFEAVFRDTSDVSMGNLRYIQNNDKRVYGTIQDFTIHHFVGPTTLRFESQAVIAGLPGYLSPFEYAQQRDDLLEQQEYDCPGFESFNPLEDAKADQINLNTQTDTNRDIAKRKGRNWRQQFKQAGVERKEREGLGLTLAGGDKSSGPQNNTTGASTSQGANE